MSRIANHPRVPLEPTPRIAPTATARSSILERQGNACARCGMGLYPFPFEIDHVLPLALGGSNEPGNLEALCLHCHKAKTARDIKAIAKAKRIAKREAGENKRSRKIAGKPLGGGPLRRKMSGEVVPR
jgi:5-methylcytosine-specific restriction endonuclease McrA